MMNIKAKRRKIINSPSTMQIKHYHDNFTNKVSTHCYPAITTTNIHQQWYWRGKQFQLPSIKQNKIKIQQQFLSLFSTLFLLCYFFFQ
jgi:hypothetical protein